MSLPVPTSITTSNVPSTKAWFLLLSLLTTLLVVNHQVQPAPSAPPVLADRQANAATPRRVVLSSPAPRPRAMVTFAASATL
jgi:hypothetical protein